MISPKPLCPLALNAALTEGFQSVLLAADRRYKMQNSITDILGPTRSSELNQHYAVRDSRDPVTFFNMLFCLEKHGYAKVCTDWFNFQCTQDLTLLNISQADYYAGIRFDWHLNNWHEQSTQAGKSHFRNPFWNAVHPVYAAFVTLCSQNGWYDEIWS